MRKSSESYGARQAKPRQWVTDIRHEVEIGAPNSTPKYMKKVEYNARLEVLGIPVVSSEKQPSSS